MLREYEIAGSGADRPEAGLFAAILTDSVVPVLMRDGGCTRPDAGSIAATGAYWLLLSNRECNVKTRDHPRREWRVQ